MSELNHIQFPAVKSAPQSPLKIQEILVLILGNLDSLDIPNAMLVCKAWHQTLRSVLHMPPFNFKIPTPFKIGGSSHFNTPCLAYRHMENNYLLKKQKLREKNDDTTENLDRIRPVIFIGENSVLQEMQHLDSHLNNILEWESWCRAADTDINERKLRALRAAFRGVRLGGSGWPVGLREIHCDICDRFHTSFRFEHLHPMLRFLENYNICIRGQEATLRLQIHILAEQRAPESCFEHYGDEVISLANDLKSAMDLIRPGGFGNEFFSRPVTKRIVAPWYHVIEDKVGITLAAVVPLLVRHLRDHMKRFRELIQMSQSPAVVSWLDKPMSSWATKELHLIHAYDNDEATFGQHKARFPDIVQRFEQVVATVDKIMISIAIWEPILYEEPDLERDSVSYRNYVYTPDVGTVYTHHRLASRDERASP